MILVFGWSFFVSLFVLLWINHREGAYAGLDFIGMLAFIVASFATLLAATAKYLGVL